MGGENFHGNHETMDDQCKQGVGELNFMTSNYHCGLGVGLSFTVPGTILGVGD